MRPRGLTHARSTRTCEQRIHSSCAAATAGAAAAAAGIQFAVGTRWRPCRSPSVHRSASCRRMRWRWDGPRPPAHDRPHAAGTGGGWSPLRWALRTAAIVSIFLRPPAAPRASCPPGLSVAAGFSGDLGRGRAGQQEPMQLQRVVAAPADTYVPLRSARSTIDRPHSVTACAECRFVSALFTSEKISDFDTIAFSFVCDKYYLIID